MNPLPPGTLETLHSPHSTPHLPPGCTTSTRYKSSRSCVGCGSASHGLGNCMSVCPAWGKTCNSCGKLYHFTVACHSPPSSTTTASGLVVHLAWDADQGTFLPATPTPLASLDVMMSPIGPNHRSSELQPLQVSVHPDTGAQVSVAGPSLVTSLGFSSNGPLTITQLVWAVGGAALHVTGYVPVLLSATASDNSPRRTHEVIYIVH